MSAVGTNTSVGPVAILNFMGQLTTQQWSFKIASMTGNCGRLLARSIIPLPKKKTDGNLAAIMLVGLEHYGGV